jgi:hypothetical protein
LPDSKADRDDFIAFINALKWQGCRDGWNNLPDRAPGTLPLTHSWRDYFARFSGSDAVRCDVSWLALCFTAFRKRS